MTIFAFALMQRAAFAQNAPNENVNKPNPNASSNSNSMSDGATQSLPQKISQTLQKQGFTNVQVVPGSFRAKDEDGAPVNMVIGRQAMTMFPQSAPTRADERGTHKMAVAEARFAQ